MDRRKWLWDWVSNLPPSAASFVSAATAAGIILIALMLAVLYNARQSRLRDGRLRTGETKGLVGALTAELKHIAKILREYIGYLKEKPSNEQRVVIPDLQQSVKIFSRTTDKLDLLDVGTLQAVFGAYTLIDGLRSRIVEIVGTDRAKEIENTGAAASLPAHMIPQIISASDRVISLIEMALEYLDKYEKKKRVS